MNGSVCRLLLIADFHGATQHISFHKPLAPLVHEGVVDITTLTELDLLAAAKQASVQNAREESMRACFRSAWNASQPSLVVFSRYGGPLTSEMLAVARAANVPVIAHFDDDLLGVPRELGPDKYRRYNDPLRLEAIREVLDGSDLIYVSTPALMRRFIERGFRKPIVAGEIYCSAPPAPPVSHRSPHVFGYMGSGGHAHDLEIALPAIINLLNTDPAVRFELFGTIPMPDGLRNFGERVTHHPPAGDYEAFIQQLCSLGWSIGLAPLADVPFNAVKADTKWVEYTTAGMAVIASDHPVYRASCGSGRGVLVDNNGWRDAIPDLLANDFKRTQIISAARAHVETDYSHSRLTRQVLALFSRVGMQISSEIYSQ